MRIFFDNVENLKTVLPGCVIERKLTKDEEGTWIYEEFCHISKSPGYFWCVRKFQFASEEEMESYMALYLLETL